MHYFGKFILLNESVFLIKKASVTLFHVYLLETIR